MNEADRESFARGVARGCAIGFAVSAGIESSPRELVDFLKVIDATREICGKPVPSLELVRAAVVERLFRAISILGRA